MTAGDDQDVTKLYHEGAAEEPPAALDRAILRAARESIAPARKPEKPWWLRFALPLQLALSAVLVSMLVLTVDRNPPDVPMPAETTQPQRTPDSAALKAAPPVASGSSGPPAAQQAPEARPRLAAPRDSTVLAPKAERKAGAAPPATPVPERGERAAAEKAETQDAAADLAGRSLEAARPGPEAGAAPGAAPSGGAPAANRVAAARSPADWLAAIERLAGTGEKTAARAELESFRKAHPEYPVPERLEKLLAP